MGVFNYTENLLNHSKTSDMLFISFFSPLNGKIKYFTNILNALYALLNILEILIMHLWKN